MTPGSEQLREHLEAPLGRGHVPAGGFTGAAGGAACGDLVRMSLALDDADRTIADAGFDASGCGAAMAAGSATVALVRGQRPARRGADRRRDRSPTSSAG